MTLGEKQKLFMRLLPRLIDYIHEQGFEGTEGDAFRDPRVHGEIGEKKGYGHPKSAHKNRLAIDINLFKDGKYLDTTEDHKLIGDFWESLHELCRWGGDFGDGNHYAIEHNGVR